MGSHHSTIKRFLGLGLAALFTFEVAAIHAAEATLWAERRRAAIAARSDAQRPRAAEKSSDDQKPSDGETLLASLPAIRPGLTTLQQPAADPLTADLFKKDGAPAWVQGAVAKYATINSVRLTGRTDSPTVFLMQDAHLHVEAQRNIAGAVEALAADIAGRGDTLLVALEGAPAGDIDFSDYAKDDARLRRAVAEALVKAQILSGAEGAAVANAGEREGRPLFSVAGVEAFGLFRENVDALRSTAADRKAAHAAIADLRRELTELKKKHFDEDLVRFDGRKEAFENGSLGLPTYALYLDAVVPAQGANLRELIEAALLEGALKFGRVESERRALLAALVERMSDAEVKSLLQASLMFRAGRFSYAAYYELIKDLAARHKVSLSDYPEMNVYVQYVLKSEGIDHRALFAELAGHEALVRKRLAKTPEQKELLSLVSDLHLLKKLVDRELIESEWHAVEGRKAELGALVDRVAALGGARPESARVMAGRWDGFEKFYAAALRRNDAMVENLRDAIGRHAAKNALMVAGGFHTDGVAELLRRSGMNVFILSPRITKIGDGPTSLDFLAAGRLPLNQIFVGEKLFLPTPMVTSMPGVRQRVRALVAGFVAAIAIALQSNAPVAAVERGGRIYSAERTAAPAGVAATVDGRTFALKALPAAATRTLFGGLSAGRAAGILVAVAGLLLAGGNPAVAAEIAAQAPAALQAAAPVAVLAAVNPIGLASGIAIALIGLAGVFAGLRVFTDAGKGSRIGLLSASVVAIVLGVAGAISSISEQKAPVAEAPVAAPQEAPQAAPQITAPAAPAPDAALPPVLPAAPAAAQPQAASDANIRPALNWIIGQRLPRSPLVGSYRVPAQRDAAVDRIDGQAFDFLGGFANTYDQAVAAIGVIRQGRAEDKALARGILDAFQDARGIPSKSNKEGEIISGEALWVGMAAVHYQTAYGENRYEALLSRLDDYVLEMVRDNGRVIGGPGKEWSSTEHNEDALSYLTARYQMTRGKDARKAAAIDDARGKIAAWMISAYNDMGKRALPRGHNDRTFASDVQFWGVLSLAAVKRMDPEFYRTSGLDAIDFKTLLEAGRRARATVEYKKPDGSVVTVSGYRYTIGESPVSGEWTFEGTIAHDVAGERDKAAAILEDMRKVVTTDRNGDKHVPYALSAGKTFRDGWTATPWPSVASTGWYIWAEQRGAFNPFDLLSTAPGIAPAAVPARPERGQEAPKAEVKRTLTVVPARFQTWSGAGSMSAYALGDFDFSDAAAIRFTFPKSQVGTLVRPRLLPDGSAADTSDGAARDVVKIQLDAAADTGFIEVPVSEFGMSAATLKTIKQISIHSGSADWFGAIKDKDGTEQGAEKTARPTRVEKVTESRGTAYVGWARAVFIVATVMAAVFYVGIDAQLVTDLSSGAVALLLAPAISALLIFAEEAGHQAVAERQGFEDARFSWRELGIVNAGDAWTMLAFGQMMFFGVGIGVVAAASLIAGSPLLYLVFPLAVMSFFNPEGRQWLTGALNSRALAGLGSAGAAVTVMLIGSSLLMLGGAGGAVSMATMATMLGVAEVRRIPGLVPAVAIPGGGSLSAGEGPSAQDLIDRAQDVLRMDDVSRPMFVGLVSLVVGAVVSMGLLFIVGPAAAVSAGAFAVVTGAGFVALTRLEDARRGDTFERRAAAIDEDGDRTATAVAEPPARAPARRTAVPTPPTPPPAPRAPVRARPAPPAAPPAPARAKPAVVEAGASRTVSRNMGRFFGQIIGNRDRKRGGQAELPIQISSARDLISFYLALAAYSDGSSSYVFEAEAMLRFSPSLSPEVRTLVTRAMRQVIFFDMTVDQLFDRFETKSADPRLDLSFASPALKGYLLTALGLKMRSNPAFARRFSSRSSDLNVRVRRNAVVGEVRESRYQFSDDNNGSQSLTVDQIAFVSIRIKTLSRLIDDNVRFELNRNLRAMQAAPRGEALSERFVEEAGSEVSKILHNNFPALRWGGSIAGFDRELGDLLRYLRRYAGFAAQRAGQPERAEEILGRMLNVASLQRVERDGALVEEEVPTIWQFGTNNVQGRRRLDDILASVSAGIELEEARASAADEANERLKEIAEAAPAAEDEPTNQVAEADPIAAEAARELLDRPLPEAIDSLRLFGRTVEAQFIKIAPLNVLSTLLFALDNGRGAERTLALLITRLEALRAAVDSGEVVSRDTAAANLGRVVSDLRRIYRSGDIDKAAVRAALGDVTNLPAVAAVISPMIKFPEAIIDAATSGPAAALGAFYNNDMAEKLAEAIVRRTNDPASVVGALVSELYAIPDAAQLGKILGSLTKLNTLAMRRGFSAQDQADLAKAIAPLFGPQMPLVMADMVLRAAAYTVDTVSSEAEKLDTEFRSFSTFFANSGIDVEVQLLDDDGAPWNQQSAFFQQVDGKLIIRITRTTFRSIVGQQRNGGLDISGTLAEVQKERLRKLGVELKNEQASDLALRIFLGHEFGEGGLAIDDSALTAAWLADAERTLQRDAVAGVRPEGAYVSKEGIVGALEGMGGKIGAPLSIRSDLSVAERRRLELAALTILSEARPILSTLFPDRTVINYTLGLSENGREVVFQGPQGLLDTENLNVFETSEVASSRVAAMSAAAEPFREMETAEIVRQLGVADPGTFTIYDLRGGFKVLADQLDALMSDDNRRGQRLETGSLRGGEDMLNDARAYVAMLERKASAAPELNEELRRGRQLLQQLELSFQQAAAEAAGQAPDAGPRARISVVALENPDLIRLNPQTGAYDVSEAVRVLQTLATARFGREFGNVVMISDWRTLVAAGIDNALSYMVVNSFVTLEDGVRATNLIAKQA